MPGDNEDGVVYLGKSGFKMKPAVRLTPVSGVSPAPLTTPIPPPRATPTPPPWSMTGATRPPGAPSRPPAPGGRLTHEVSLAKGTLAGLCMTMFSCGIMCAVAIYRFVPNLRPDCALAVAENGGAVPALVVPAVESAPAPPTPIIVATTPAPPPTTPASPPAAPARVSPVAHRGPARGKARGGRIGKRAARPTSDGTMPLTDRWTDPFAQ